MSNNFKVLRYEVNYLLFAVETCLGANFKNHAEDSLNYIFYCFFFNKQDPELNSTIDTLQIYISSVCDGYEEIYPSFKNDIPTIIELMELIRSEMCIIV